MLHKSVLVGLLGIGATFGFLLGFNISTSTGVEPGFFDKPEAGGYGAGAGGAKVPEGLSEELADYYSDLANK